MTAAVQAGLDDGLTALGLDLAAPQRQALLDYLGLLGKWNRVYNLTAVRDPNQMLTQHLLDCLAVVAPLRRELARLQDRPAPARILDVGAGAGLPGVVLAVCCPEAVVHCVDTVAKKAAFVQQAAATLQLTNLRGLHTRVETLNADYDLVASRAFASLRDFTDWSQAALRERGVWMAMKGKRPTDELTALPPTIDVFHVEPIVVPGLDAERCLVWMRRQAA